ncbi:MAG: hypothetical protein AAFV80_22375 [Bacteroidota bacterium]
MSRTAILGLDLGGQALVFGSGILSLFFFPLQPLMVWLVFVLVSWQVGNQINYLFYFWSQFRIKQVVYGGLFFLASLLVLLIRADQGWLKYLEFGLVLLAGGFALIHAYQSYREYLYWKRKPKSFWDMI